MMPITGFTWVSPSSFVSKIGSGSIAIGGILANIEKIHQRNHHVFDLRPNPNKDGGRRASQDAPRGDGAPIWRIVCELRWF